MADIFCWQAADNCGYVTDCAAHNKHDQAAVKKGDVAAVYSQRGQGMVEKVLFPLRDFAKFIVILKKHSVSSKKTKFFFSDSSKRWHISSSLFDLEEEVTQGETLNEALFNAAEVLTLVMEHHLEQEI